MIENKWGQHLSSSRSICQALSSLVQCWVMFCCELKSFVILNFNKICSNLSIICRSVVIKIVSKRKKIRRYVSIVTTWSKLSMSEQIDGLTAKIEWIAADRYYFWQTNLGRPLSCIKKAKVFCLQEIIVDLSSCVVRDASTVNIRQFQGLAGDCNRT